MLATLQRQLRRLRARLRRGAGDGENSYWQELTDADIRAGAHRDFVGGMWDEIGELQFRFLVAQGLRPEHRLLDVGCGALRGGVHFVRYLQPGHYFGIDRNRSLIDAGRRELAAAGLADRGATLMADASFAVSSFGVQFDYAIAVSLFTHLYMNHVIRCLDAVSRVLSPGGKFYATFFEAPHPAHVAKITHSPGDITTNLDSDPFHYSYEELAACARYVGMRVERIADWQHPRGQKILCFTGGK